MKVVSCFDGISCGQVALNRIGVTDYQYFASEIDKHAIKVTQHNFPNTIQMGDVRNLVNIAASGVFGEVDLLMGGSPCQGFSNAGKQLGFVDPRSKLFFDFVAIKNFLKPKWFLLENVRMKKQDQDIISALMGVEPIKINSADFSAQNRVRLYWTNIPVAPWQDRGIVLRDILEHSPTDKKGEVVYNKPIQVNPDKSAGGLQPHMQDRVFDDRGKSHALTASFAKQTNVQTYMKQLGHGFNPGYEKAVEKAPPLTTSSWQQNNFVATDPNLIWRRLSVRECERLQTLPDDYTKVMGYKLNKTPSRIQMWSDGKGTGYGNKDCRNITDSDKSGTLTTKVDRFSNAGLVEFEDFCRYLTPTEYERLQTLPDDYTQVVSDSQRYKAIGNGWTVDVIAHILKGMYDPA